MLRSRYLSAVLVLAAATAACESDPFAIEEAESLIEHIADDPLQAVLTTESGATDLRGRNDNSRKASIFDTLNEQIEGFGGLYRTSPCIVAVVLTEGADVDEAVRIVTAVVEPLVGRPCADGITVEPVRGEFTYDELRRFLKASRPLNSIIGVGGAYISFKDNRLVILVASRRVANVVTASLPRVGIPVEAVLYRRGRTIERPDAADRPAPAPAKPSH